MEREKLLSSTDLVLSKMKTDINDSLEKANKVIICGVGFLRISKDAVIGN